MNDIVKSGKADERYKKLMGEHEHGVDGNEDNGGEDDEEEHEAKGDPAECYGRAFDALKSGDREAFVKAMMEAEEEEEE
jgi:hypothetical protein